MHKLLRIGAMICAILAAWMFWNLRGGSFSEHELVIERKYTSGEGSAMQFRIRCELPFPQRGFTYDTTVSDRFYQAARTGDSVRSPLNGYLQLVREGRVIAHHLSDGFIFPAVYSIVGLFPLVAFIRFRNVTFARIVLILVGFAEVLVIGSFLYGTLVPCC